MMWDAVATLMMTIDLPRLKMREMRKKRKMRNELEMEMMNMLVRYPSIFLLLHKSFEWLILLEKIHRTTQEKSLNEKKWKKSFHCDSALYIFNALNAVKWGHFQIHCIKLKWRRVGGRAISKKHSCSFVFEWIQFYDSI